MPGTKCTADLLTKVLSKETNDFHRAQLGNIEILEQEEWQAITNKELKKQPKRSDVQVVEVHDDDPSVEDLSTFSSGKDLSVGGLEDFESFLRHVHADGA